MAKETPGRRDGLVYSSEFGHTCPHCHRPYSSCTCRNPRGGGDGIVRVGRETKGRKGKGVTVITGLRLPPSDLAALAKSLKQRCGSGGTVRDGVIEIQGDHRDAILLELEKRGYRVKRAGG